MKNIIIKTLLAVLLVGSIVGCSSNNDSNNKTDVKKEDEKQQLQITDQGWSLAEESNFVSFGVIIKNPNKKYVVENTRLKVTGKDASGKILFAEDFGIGYISPNDTMTFGYTIPVSEGIATSVDISVSNKDDDFTTNINEIAQSSSFVISNTSETFDDYGDAKYTGEITNNSTLTFEKALIAVIYKNDGKIVGGEFTTIDNLGVGVATAFQLDVHSKVPHNEYEIHALGWVKNGLF